MGKETNIAWCDHTYNRWFGCTHVSPGCDNCYAEADEDHRRGRAQWGPHGARVPVSAETARRPHAWNAEAGREGVRRRVFCSSLGDVFDQHPSIPAALKEELWQTIAATQNLDWLILTKRPAAAASDIKRFCGGKLPPNVWLGVSAENQEWFDRRWALLRTIPARIRFISYEPALGPIRLHARHEGLLHWVIYGGETSLRRGVSRAANAQWARDIRDDCRSIKAAFFYKQTGNWIDGRWTGKGSATYAAVHGLLDGESIRELPL